MGRKRDRWTRERAKRVRPTAQAPKGWLLTELAQLTRIPVSTVRYYVHQRLLRPIEFRGTKTRYSRRELLMLLGLHRLEEEGDLTLIERKRRLDALAEQELKQAAKHHTSVLSGSRADRSSGLGATRRIDACG